MASQVEIFNRALIKLGAGRITSMQDDSEAARVGLAIWETVVKNELRANNWNFAIRRASLAADVATPDWGFAYQYTQPVWCLKVIQVSEYYLGVSLTDYRGYSEAPYKIEGRKILTDLGAPLPIRGIQFVEDTAQWDACFVEAVASRLADQGCERITQSNTKRESALIDYKRAIDDALEANALEIPSEPLPDDSWIISRL
jgi:hypothetical protein